MSSSSSSSSSNLDTSSPPPDVSERQPSPSRLSSSSSSSSSSSGRPQDDQQPGIPLRSDQARVVEPNKLVTALQTIKFAVAGYLALLAAEIMTAIRRRLRYKSACLPADDPNPAARAEQLLEAKREYRWNYDFFSLPFIDGLPENERPTIAFVKGLLGVLGDLFNNSLALRYGDKAGFVSKAGKAVYRRVKLATRQLWGVKENSILTVSNSLGSQVRNILVDGTNTNPATSLNDYSIQFTHHIGIPSIARLVFPRLPQVLDNDPADLTANTLSDIQFAWYRVAGPNPLSICKATEERMVGFAVSDETLSSLPAFAGDCLQDAREENRLYMVDYSYLHDVPMREGRFHYAPKALFCVPKEGGLLLPVAIQCGPDPEKYPVYTPRSRQMDWIAAKTMIQVADAMAHITIFHLGRCHMTLEPIVCASHRCLAAKHPLLRLLAEHFTGTALINFAGTLALIDEDGTADRILSPPIADSNKIVAEVVASSDLNAWMPKRDFKDRGVESEKLVYPFRDDALALWNAIESWVDTYLKSYYSDDSAVSADAEVQKWIKELRTKGGLGGIGEDGVVETVDQLISLVTMIIYTASVQHSAVNFPQWSMMAFTPLMPVAGYIPAPTMDNPFPWEGRDLTESEQYAMYLSQMLPPMDAARSQLFVMKLLATLHFSQLGSYPRYSLDLSRPERATSLSRLQSSLAALEKTIAERNVSEKQKGLLPYTYLLPSKIPASTNI